jgi:acetyl esterase/lipase
MDRDLLWAEPMANPTIHPLDPADADVMTSIRVATQPLKGRARGIEARAPFDAAMENVPARSDVTFEPDTAGGVPGLWVRPAKIRSSATLLHLHGGWFTIGTANAYRHSVAQLATRVGANAFVPDYRLAPEHPFPAAPDDVLACYRGLATLEPRIAITGDSAGGNLAIDLACRVPALAVAVLSPVTDLSLSGETYETRARVDPFFTRDQVASLVSGYLVGQDPKHPLASPLFGDLARLPALRIDVGDDEVLLDDSRRLFERATAAGVDARLDVWTGMPHGFTNNVGTMKAATLALDAIAAFLSQRLTA